MKRGRSFYIVYPKYVFKGTEKDRRALLTKLIYKGIRNNEDIRPLINVPVAEFMKPTEKNNRPVTQSLELTEANIVRTA